MIKPEELVPLMILEWIKGDKQGTQEIIKEVEVMGEFTWVNFHSGGRINGHTINEFMILIGVAQEGDVEKHIQAKQDAPDSLEVAPPVTQKTVTAPSAPVTPEPTNTFGFDILDKANRDSKMELNIVIDFPFISEEKIKMLLELYGEELRESLKDYIRQQLTEDVICGCIEEYLNHKFPQKVEVNNLVNEETNE